MDDFIEQRPRLMQPIVGRAVGRTERSAAFFAPKPAASALSGDVGGMADDVALVQLSSQGAIGVGTSTR